MITEIGIIAGDIWHYLDAHGPVTLSRLVRELDRSRELVFMSVGWLAREGHVILTAEGKDYRVALRKGS
ncbi:MAG: winged helix-turn-helix domain-containing protein [Deltaproteobacteria bacterium]